MSESICAACGAACTGPEQLCQACFVSGAWQDLFHAAAVAREQCTRLHQAGLLSEAELQRLGERLASMESQWTERQQQGLPPPRDTGLPSALHCRQCERPANAMQKFCATCGGVTGPQADRPRHLDFVVSLLTGNAAEIAPERAGRCVIDIRARIKAIETELKGEATGRPVQDETAAPPSGRRNLIEILLDPNSIRWLLGSGGVLLTVGLVIFLSSLGVFENAMVVASSMGVGTVAILCGGIATIRFTRHTLAGRAMALLGCLVMPFNLWFYHANGLVTLDGHLWLAAMVCCVLYAAAAFVLKDPMFVYVLFGGITMTGLLTLADLHRLVEVSAPATLLVALGLISLHAERAFADDDGPFSRKRFGLACFRSAHAMIGLGLLVLLGSQLAIWLPGMGFGLQRVAALQNNQWLALALVLAGGYSYAYSSLVVRPNKVFGQAAILCVLWAELLGIRIGHLQHHLPVLVAAAGVVGLIVHRIINAGRADDDRRAGSLLNGAHAMLSLPLTGVMLLTLSRLATGQMQLSMLWTPAWLSLLSLIAAITSAGGARRWYLALLISQVTLCLVTLGQYSTLSLPRKLELLSMLGGVVLILVGYGIWYRTQDGRSSGAGWSLFAGALLAGLPPAIFAMANRFGYEVSFVDELSLVTIAVLMFLTGAITQVRATTLIGGGLLVCHLLTLIVFAGMKAQLALGAYVSIGGALLFAVGVVLSINRDRLLALPQRIKQRQGIFRVLAWT